jgi:hypothetical protein
VKKVFLIILLAVFSLSGCFFPGSKVITDVPSHGSFPLVKSIHADGDILTIEIDQNKNALGIVGFDTELINGEIHIKPVCISNPVSMNQFKLDFSRKNSRGTGEKNYTGWSPMQSRVR